MFGTKLRTKLKIFTFNLSGDLIPFKTEPLDVTSKPPSRFTVRHSYQYDPDGDIHFATLYSANTGVHEVQEYIWGIKNPKPDVQDTYSVNLAKSANPYYLQMNDNFIAVQTENHFILFKRGFGLPAYVLKAPVNKLSFFYMSLLDNYVLNICPY